MATAFVDSLGTGLFYAASVLFFTLFIGIPGYLVGLGLMAAGFCGLFATVPLAKAADRFDPFRTLAAIQLMRGLLFLSYLAVKSTGGFIAVVCLLGCLQRPVAPVTQSVIFQITGGVRRVDALARLRVFRNIGLGLGALIASVALIDNHAVAFIALLAGDSLSFFVSTAMLLRIRYSLHDSSKFAPRIRTAAAHSLSSAPIFDVTYMGAALCNGALALCQSSLEVGLPLWIVTSGVAPTFIPAGLVTINTALVIAFQRRVARSAGGASGARRHIMAASICLAVFAILTAGTAILHSGFSLVLLSAGVIMLTFGEMWQSSSSWFVGNEYADPARRSEYLAAFSMGNTVQTIAGPAIFSTFVIPLGGLGWGALSAFFLIAGLIYISIASRLSSRAPQHSAESAANIQRRKK